MLSSQFAALDLGSNSFHLVIAENRDGRLQVIDKLKEMVRLAAGLNKQQQLDPLVAQRALDCLSRFGQRLQNIPSENIRVVGTNTLRRIRHGKDFMQDAQQALGQDIEVVSGQEEARLIYLGVSHALEDSNDQRLVIDIGGGSTELILGQQFNPQKLESLFMGCVTYSRRFFAAGRVKKNAMQLAKLQALHELEPIQGQFRRPNWETAIGASGTILAVRDVLQANGWSQQSITYEGLTKLFETLAKAKDSGSVKLEGLAEERHSVFPGGVAILTAIFEALKIKTMLVSSGALREGLLFDLLGRTTSEDIRENSVQDLISRYQIDARHANRVVETACKLFGALAKPLGLSKTRHLPLLRWAALLHEIGMDVSHRQYHKHGGYLIKHMDLAGFSHTTQDHLALLVRAHRRKFPLAEFEIVTPKDRPALILLATLLRLSVVLHRNRSRHSLPGVEVQAGEATLTCLFPPGWLDQHPLTRLDLDQEAEFLDLIPLTLSIIERAFNTKPVC